MILKLIFSIYCSFYFNFGVNSVPKDDFHSIKSYLKTTKTEREVTEVIDNKLIEIKALNLSDTQIIGDFEDNKITINCPFGKKKKDYYYIKWFIDGKEVSDRQLRNRTQIRMSLKDNQILILYLKPEDSALYSCQLRSRINTTVEELAKNSTNFELNVYRFGGGGLDPRSPKVAVKLTFLSALFIFSYIVFRKTEVNSEFE